MIMLNLSAIFMAFCNVGTDSCLFAAHNVDWADAEGADPLPVWKGTRRVPGICIRKQSTLSDYGSHRRACGAPCMD
jgi:hypothetical protein